MSKNIDLKHKDQEQTVRSTLTNVSRGNSIKAIALALYITFLLISTIPFMADNTIEPEMNDTYEYHLTYPVDGRQTHYYVERVNISKPGIIDLIYTTASNSLVVKTENIEVLHIYCRSLYEDECKNVFNIEPEDYSNYFKWYFIEKNHLTVNVESDTLIKELSFIDTPVPYQVYVSGKLWKEGRQYNFTDSYKTILSNVPLGKTHIDIYFKTDELARPYANIDADKSVVNIDTVVYFDATRSYDVDGEIISYIWDFGDGNNSGGIVNAHSYSKPGTYGVILTVRDDDSLVDHAYLNITVIQGTNEPVINGIIPNQVRPEDSSPWELDLTIYGIDLESSPDEFRWYITGENSSLYQVVGENSTDQKLIFTPVPNAFGNDQVILWLMNKDRYTDNQTLWINITSINDPPIIEKLPSLVIHYAHTYRLSIIPYIYDIETPRDDLKVFVQDKFGNQYAGVNGQELILEYPEELVDEIILITVIVSDGEDNANGIISITITDGWPPVLIKELPDVELNEGGTIKDVFNLDDYFSDHEDDKLYYSFSNSHVQMLIKKNNSVDITSLGDWTGTEEVVFRARDSDGGLREDVIKITVLPVNSPPVIGQIPDLMVHYDMDYYFDVSYYIADPDNELSELTLATTDSGHIRISPKNNLGIILNYPQSMLGSTIKVVLSVSDGSLETKITISVTVIAEYPPELVTKLPDVVFLEDEVLIDHFDLDDYFLDLDNDTLYYTTGNVMVNITIDPEHKVSFSTPDNWFGSEEVTFRATDPVGALVEDGIHVSVLPVTDPPKLLSLPKITIHEEETLEFNLAPYLIDPDTNITELIIEVNDKNVFVSGSTLIIFGSTDLPKKIQINITDGDFTITGELKLNLILKQKKKQNDLSNLILIFIAIIILILVTIGSILRYLQYRMQKFKIEEVFLIHNSGKLLTHVSHKTHSKFDDDIFSGMFTAIQQFIEDSFSMEVPSTSDEIKPGSKNELTKTETSDLNKKPMKLNEFKVGDNQVLVEHGKYIFMAVVYDGPGSQALHKKIKKGIIEIENKFGTALEDWIGDMNQLRGLYWHVRYSLFENESVDQNGNDLKNSTETRMQKITINEYDQLNNK